MTERPYHKYVFDAGRRTFVGRFDEMYRQEGIEHFDSWFQEDLRSLPKQVSLAILGRYNFGRCLDIGCGKGTFTHLLKKSNNVVVGIDISEAAIVKARAKYPDIEFRLQTADELELGEGEEPFDLVVVMELLSYVERWREVLSRIAAMTRFGYVTLYLPDEPIGFVKSFDELLAEVRRSFDVETEVRLNRDHLLLLLESRVLGRR